MFQSFDDFSEGEKGPQRLAALRKRLSELGFQGWLAPRADAHQGESIAPSDERLAWLTGFTGSAGFCAVLEDRAALFVDGRYTIQAPQQVATDVFEVVSTPETKPEDWLKTHAGGAKIGFDPWLHTPAEIERMETALADTGATLIAHDGNAIDDIWEGRPPPPSAPIEPYSIEYAGVDATEKRAKLAKELSQDGVAAAILTRPDSIAWLFNIRGGDVARTPIALAFAILRADGSAALFADQRKFGEDARAHLGQGVDLLDVEEFGAALDALGGAKIALERASAPVWLVNRLNAAKAEVCWRSDPCSLPKARKNAAELAGARAAHLRDAAAMARFLCWMDRTAPDGGLTEIDAAIKLEALRAENAELRDISFDTISAAGPHAALPHYRVTHASNRSIKAGEIYLIDSGGQYVDGTTDITRTIAIGDVDPRAVRPFTLVLKGMIAVSRVRFPAKTTGRDLDVLARGALWRAGLDYDHGTGHGVGAYLGVHEGPQNLSRRGDAVPIEPGMIVSNEPGYYREGAFGIRIENLLAATEPEEIDGGEREMLEFETLTWAPIDRRLIDSALLDADERAWLDAYHARVEELVAPLVDAETQEWLRSACAPL